MDQVYDCFHNKIVEQVEVRLHNLVYDQVCSRIFRPLNQFWNQMQGQIQDQIKNPTYNSEILEQVHNQIFEQYWDHCRNK
jgi:hypothetical protein